MSRFAAKFYLSDFEVRPGIGPCWIWSQHKNPKGYGIFKNRKGTSLAHRASLEEKLGRRLLPGIQTLHSCDTKACINPDHLSEGTLQKNVSEAVERGLLRRRPRDRRRIDELSQQEISAILAGPLDASLVERLNVSRRTMTKVRRINRLT